MYMYTDVQLGDSQEKFLIVDRVYCLFLSGGSDLFLRKEVVRQQTQLHKRITQAFQEGKKKKEREKKGDKIL